MTDEYPIPLPGIGRGFAASTRRFVLTSPNGSRIVLDADMAKIQMYGINGLLLAELDAAQEFFGQSLYVQRIYDFLGLVRSQWSSLQLFIDGNDGRVEIKAGSSGVPTSLPQITFLPPSAVNDAWIRGEGLADDGARLQITSPSYATHDQAQIDLYAEDDLGPAHVDIGNAMNVAGDTTVTGDATVSGILTAADGSILDDLTVGDLLDFAAANRSGDQLGFNVANIWNSPPPAPAGLTSGTFITITGASTATFVKQRANTRVDVMMTGGGYITAGAGATVGFGILISGGIGDFEICRGSFSVLSNRIQFSGSRLLTAFAAGSYTITPRWRRVANTSTINMDAVDATLSVSLREVVEL